MSNLKYNEYTDRQLIKYATAFFNDMCNEGFDCCNLEYDLDENGVSNYNLISNYKTGFQVGGFDRKTFEDRYRAVWSEESGSEVLLNDIQVRFI